MKKAIDPLVRKVGNELVEATLAGMRRIEKEIIPSARNMLERYKNEAPTQIVQPPHNAEIQPTNAVTNVKPASRVVPENNIVERGIERVVGSVKKDIKTVVDGTVSGVKLGTKIGVPLTLGMGIVEGAQKQIKSQKVEEVDSQQYFSEESISNIMAKAANSESANKCYNVIRSEFHEMSHNFVKNYNDIKNKAIQHNNPAHLDLTSNAKGKIAASAVGLVTGNENVAPATAALITAVTTDAPKAAVTIICATFKEVGLHVGQHMVKAMPKIEMKALAEQGVVKKEKGTNKEQTNVVKPSNVKHNPGMKI